MFVVTYITIRKHERYVSSWMKNKAGSRVSARSMNTGCLQGGGDRSWGQGVYSLVLVFMFTGGGGGGCGGIF